MFVRRPRGRSCPVKPSSEPRVKCFFFHRCGRCIWGSFCRYQHDPPKKKYGEKVNWFLAMPTVQTIMDPRELLPPLALELPRYQDPSPSPSPAQLNV